MCEHKIVSETACNLATICGHMIVTIADHNFVDTPAALLVLQSVMTEKNKAPHNCGKIVKNATGRTLDGERSAVAGAHAYVDGAEGLRCALSGQRRRKSCFSCCHGTDEVREL